MGKNSSRNTSFRGARNFLFPVVVLGVVMVLLELSGCSHISNSGSYDNKMEVESVPRFETAHATSGLLQCVGSLLDSTDVPPLKIASNTDTLAVGADPRLVSGYFSAGLEAFVKSAVKKLETDKVTYLRMTPIAKVSVARQPGFKEAIDNGELHFLWVDTTVRQSKNPSYGGGAELAWGNEDRAADNTYFHFVKRTSIRVDLDLVNPETNIGHSRYSFVDHTVSDNSVEVDFAIGEFDFGYGFGNKTEMNTQQLQVMLVESTLAYLLLDFYKLNPYPCLVSFQKEIHHTINFLKRSKFQQIETLQAFLNRLGYRTIVSGDINDTWLALNRFEREYGLLPHPTNKFAALYRELYTASSTFKDRVDASLPKVVYNPTRRELSVNIHLKEGVGPYGKYALLVEGEKKNIKHVVLKSLTQSGVVLLDLPAMYDINLRKVRVVLLKDGKRIAWNDIDNINRL